MDTLEDTLKINEKDSKHDFIDTIKKIKSNESSIEDAESDNIYSRNVFINAFLIYFILYKENFLFLFSRK